MIYWIFPLIAFVASPLATAGAATVDCGSPPPVDDVVLKGHIEGEARFLSRFIGDAALSGEIESARTEIFSKYSDADERSDAYFEYMVCSILVNDGELSATEKLYELGKIRRSFDEPVTIDQSVRQKSGNYSPNVSHTRGDALFAPTWGNDRERQTLESTGIVTRDLRDFRAELAGAYRENQRVTPPTTAHPARSARLAAPAPHSGHRR